MALLRRHQNTRTAQQIADRIRDLSHRKTQAEIASESGFPKANMTTILKSGHNQVPLDRVPSLAKTLEVDPAFCMRLALEQAVIFTQDRGRNCHPIRLELPIIPVQQQVIDASATGDVA